MSTTDRRAPFDERCLATCRPGQMMRPAPTPDLRLDDDDVALLREGLGRVGPAVAFMFSVEGSTLHVWRSSDGAEVYRARLEFGPDGGATVTALLVEHEESSQAGLDLEPVPFVTTVTSLLWTARQLRDGNGPDGGASPA